MANQNIGTPRFYISWGDYWHTLGATINPRHTIRTHEVSDYFIAEGNYGIFYREIHPHPTHSIGINWLAVLNQRIEGYGFEERFRFRFKQQHIIPDGEGGYLFNASENIPTSLASYTDLINIQESTYSPTSGLDGFSLVTWGGFTSNFYQEALEEGLNPKDDMIAQIYLGLVTPSETPVNEDTLAGTIGSMCFGRYYDMPHSPELSLTIAHEYEGIKKQETSGGSTLGYVNYHKPPDWGDNLQAWQLDGWDRKYSGRRVWDLSWNYLSDSDIEPKHYNMDESHPDWNEDGNWFTNVLHYTNGGQLPFIFCPDPSIGYYTDTWTIPEFAICRFDMKTFKREQVANGVYNIKVKIKETW